MTWPRLHGPGFHQLPFFYLRTITTINATSTVSIQPDRLINTLNSLYLRGCKRQRFLGIVFTTIGWVLWFSFRAEADIDAVQARPSFEPNRPS